MRRVLGACVCAGGLVAALAFFLPWVGLSCQGQTVSSISAWDRAAGTSVPDAGEQEQTIPADRSAWLLLLVPLGVAATGAGMIVSLALGRPSAAGAGVLAVLGLLLTARWGLSERLGVSLDDADALAGVADVAIQLLPGVYVAIGAHAFAASAAWLGFFVGDPRASRPPGGPARRWR